MVLVMLLCYDVILSAEAAHVLWCEGMSSGRLCAHYAVCACCVASRLIDQPVDQWAAIDELGSKRRVRELARGLYDTSLVRCTCVCAVHPCGAAVWRLMAEPFNRAPTYRSVDLAANTDSPSQQRL